MLYRKNLIIDSSVPPSSPPLSKWQLSHFFCGWLESIDQGRRNKKLLLKFFEILIFVKKREFHIFPLNSVKNTERKKQNSGDLRHFFFRGKGNFFIDGIPWKYGNGNSGTTLGNTINFFSTFHLKIANSNLLKNPL